MRTLLEINVSGLKLRGTCHRTNAAGAKSPTGIIFLNSGFLPRSSQGDVTAHQSDDLAERGYLVFRFDMPGLGDSEGDLDENALVVMRKIQNGAHAFFARDLLYNLAGAYSLERMILAGHCGGAVTAIYAAAEMRCPRLHGLMLYEPDFRMQSRGEESARSLAAYQEFKIALLKTRAGPAIHKAFVALKSARPWPPGLSHQHSKPTDPSETPPSGLPAEANLNLLAAWRKVVAEQLSILVITAPVKKRNPEFDYIRYLLKSASPLVNHFAVDGTNHAFVEGEGERRIVELTGRWVEARFPLHAVHELSRCRVSKPIEQGVFPA